MRYLFIAFVALLTLQACKKEKTKRELLIASPWYLQGYTIDPPQVINGAVVTDLYTYVLEDCDKDGIYYFYDNDTYKFDEGATKCDAADPQTKSGTWALVNRERDLRVSLVDTTIDWAINQLGEDVLKLSYSGRDNANVLHTLEYTYEH